MITTITHACGHQEEIQVLGKRADRERKIAWLESQLCAECRAREGAAQGAAKGWAALEGSPKQIAWAEDIRGETMDAIAGLKTRTDDEAARKDRVIAYLGGITSAAWWIDNRFYAGAKMIRRAIKHAAEHGIDLIAEPVEEPAKEPVEETAAEPVAAVETAEPVETAETTEPTEEPAEAAVEELVEEPVEAAETTETDDIMEYLLNPPEPPPMTEEEKAQAEFEQDVSMYNGISTSADDRAEERMIAFQHDLKARGKDQEYWDKIVAAVRDFWAASLE